MTAILEKSIHEFTVGGTELQVSTISRSGELAPMVFLHGFGCSKEDYADFVHHPAFAGRPFLAWDAPGFGETACADLSSISIPFHADTALTVLERAGIDRFHLAGHSMGGLTALMLAHAQPERVLSFTNIEGNISPEDCFLSRQIFEYANPDPDAFFAAFVERIRKLPAYGCALYAASLPHKVRAGAVRGIFSSIVELSDHGGLMEKFLGLPCPKMFLYGEQNAGLSYLADIEARGVRLAEIPQSGHFPMYSNAPAMWGAIAEFVGNS